MTNNKLIKCKNNTIKNIYKKQKQTNKQTNKQKQKQKQTNKQKQNKTKKTKQQKNKNKTKNTKILCGPWTASVTCHRGLWIMQIDT